VLRAIDPEEIAEVELKQLTAPWASVAEITARHELPATVRARDRED
jgi:hypothetical protein